MPHQEVVRVARIHLTIHRHDAEDTPTVDFETIQKVVSAIEALGFRAEMADNGAIVFVEV